MVIDGLSYIEFTRYYNSMRVVNAQELLSLSSVHSYPHSKKEYQNRFVKRLKQVANDFDKHNGRLPTAKDIFASFRKAVGIG